jgi:hypothetical protein
MTLVYGQEPTDAFFALLDDTIVLDVAYTHSTPTLQAAIIGADARIAYDDFRHRLSHTGVLSATAQVALKAAAGVMPDAAALARFRDAVDALFARSEDAKGSYFARHPELKPLYDAYVASADPPATKRMALLAAFRPELSRRRKRQQALQRLSVAAAVDLAFAQSLLDPPAAPYPLHAAGFPDQPALNDVLALETPGLAVQFYFRNTATGVVDLSVPAVADLNYARGGGNLLPLNPTPGAISGIWTGRVETPETGFYNFVIEGETGATVTLTLGGAPCPLTQNGNIWRNSDSLPLQAGTLYEFVLTVDKIRDTLRIKWETPKRAREVIPSRYLYPPTIIAPFADVYTRFLKAASLAAGLSLTANELAHIATHADYRVNAQGRLDPNGHGWLNALPNADNLHLASAADAAVARILNATLLTPLRALLDFARIKAAISPGDESLLSALQDPVAATAKADSLLYTLARWEPASLTALLTRFADNIAGLSHLGTLCRVYDTFALTQTMGISAKGLISTATNEPTGDTVRDLQAALRARYDASSWRDVVQPINNEMRGLQRDALVAYVLHQMRSNNATKQIDTADKLFEYFLMDVQMDPCMQTSRIRHALSSVQLFIDRCLMNLEPRVSPSSIVAKQWAWMKRYRVWEANRKIFFFPENWLEPELRDDKSPFFKEIESELLQSDITEDSAATALLNYLANLAEVAHLEPCGIHHVESNGRTGEVDHVIARASGAHRKYYYRRYEEGSWTPWEQVKLDIEDNPVVPCVWNDRLLLFWLRILKQGPETGQKPTGGLLTELKVTDLPPDPRVMVHAVLCWSEYYNGKWQATKTSDHNHPTVVSPSEYFDRSNVQLQIVPLDDSLLVAINPPGYGFGPRPPSSAGFVLYNTHSLPVIFEDAALPPLGHTWYDRFFISGSTSYPFSIIYAQQYLMWPPFQLLGIEKYYQFSRDVLANNVGNRIVEPQPEWPTDWPSWDKPFFFEDSRHVFYVTSKHQWVSISLSTDFGVTISRGDGMAAKLPPLVLKDVPQGRIAPKFPVDGRPIEPDLGVMDPAAMQRFVTEDAYIRQGIGATGGVTYGDRQIGPSGAIPNGKHVTRQA